MARPRHFKVFMDGKTHSARRGKLVGDTYAPQFTCPYCGAFEATLEVEVNQYGFEHMASVMVQKCLNCEKEWFREGIWENGVLWPQETPLTKR